MLLTFEPTKCYAVHMSHLPLRCIRLITFLVTIKRGVSKTASSKKNQKLKNGNIHHGSELDHNSQTGCQTKTGENFKSEVAREVASPLDPEPHKEHTR